ncbi:MAG: patatin-like phospholipase family protein, partial [Elusimicrobia bacterium]|nr:patatin-like phospholipase family protein [Elusimicrobiota bacterium]
MDAIAVNLALGRRTPSVLLGMDYELTGQTFPLRQNNWDATVGVRLPFSFDFWTQHHQRLSEQRQSEVRRAELRDRIQLEVRRAYADLMHWQAEWPRREKDWQTLKDLGERAGAAPGSPAWLESSKLVLSAGAVRGLAHIGVISVLQDAGFPVDVVAGTSMGAFVGAFEAAGMKASRMREIGSNVTLSSGSDLSKVRLVSMLLSDSLLSSAPMEAMLNSTIGERRFDQLAKPFACVAMDIRTGEKVVFRDGP